MIYQYCSPKNWFQTVHILISFIAFFFFCVSSFASEVEFVSLTGDLGLEVDVSSFDSEQGAFEEIAIRFPAVHLTFTSQGDSLFVGRYIPHLELLNEQGKPVKKLGGERVFSSEVEIRNADHFVYDVARFQLPSGYYHAVLDVGLVGSARKGRAVFPVVVPEFRTGKLALSDLFFVGEVDPSGGAFDADSFGKAGHILLPAPAREVDFGQNLSWYVELYEIGQLAHTVQFQILDPVGHAVWQTHRAFPAYREKAQFIEQASLRGLLPGVYTLKAEANVGGQAVSTARKFRIRGSFEQASSHFNSQRQALAKALLKKFADADVVDQFDQLVEKDRASFFYGYWREQDPLFAQIYVGPVTGLGTHEVSMALLRALGQEGTLKKRVDRTFGARLPQIDTLMVAQTREYVDFVFGQDKADPYALCAKALVALEGGALPEGEDYARLALKADSGLAQAHNAMGIAKIGRKDWDEAVAQFEQAADVSLVNVELARFLSGKGNDEDELGYLNSAIAKDPTHPWFYYMIGRVLERKGVLDQSAVAYVKQIEVNPQHGRAQFDYGRVLFKKGHIDSAIVVWQTLAQARPDLRGICVRPLLDAYLNTGETGKAQALIAEELRALGPDVRARVEDISLVAGPEELSTYNSLAGEAQAQFVRAFWQKRDPTPATPGNERLVEHYRRVIYALQNYSKDGKRWDRRGDIYIRYGEPRHISKRGDIRYETDPAVVKVKERLLGSLSPEAKQEILARSTRLRTSTRDVEIEGDHAESVTVSDFESIDFEMNPNRVFFSTDTDDVNRYVRDKQLFGRDRPGMSEKTIRGIPLYPVNGSEPWEYWIYPDVAGGIEVVFTALGPRGGFDFPDVSQGRKIAQFNQRLWEDTRPEIVLSRSIKVQPDRYVRVGKGIVNFHYAAADFRGHEGRSRLEVYYGVPVLDVMGEAGGEAVFERGVALFDSSWVPIYRKLTPMSVAVDKAGLEAGTLAIDELALQIEPGRYYLGVQVNHPASNRRGGYTQELLVDDYSVSGLLVSDIELAGRVIEDSTLVGKGGLDVTSLPSRTYKLGNPVVIYYEVYGLLADEFGQTNYRVDYRITAKKGKLSGVQVLRALGRLIGIEEKAEVTISYERKGTKADEHNYLEIDPGKSKEGRYEITVTVTDLNADEIAEKAVMLLIGK